MSPTLTGDHQNRVTDYTVLVCAGFKAGQSKAGGIGWQEECAATLSAKCSGTEPTVCVKAFDQQRIGQYGQTGTASTLVARLCKSAADVVVEKDRKHIVRRLTPLECCRLQGYPDGWTENISFDALSQEQVDQLEPIRKTWAEVNGKNYKPCKDRAALEKWFNGLQTDSAEYKAYGNSLAIPCSYDVIRRVANAIKEDKTE